MENNRDPIQNSILSFIQDNIQTKNYTSGSKGVSSFVNQPSFYKRNCIQNLKSSLARYKIGENGNETPNMYSAHLHTMPVEWYPTKKVISTNLPANYMLYSCAGGWEGNIPAVTRHS